MGVFAKQNIVKGDVVEHGLMRRVDCNGHNNEYLFSWSNDRKTWAFASGCATFYNTSLTPNVKMNRYFELDQFTIIALEDIKKGDELFHKYISLS